MEHLKVTARTNNVKGNKSALVRDLLKLIQTKIQAQKSFQQNTICEVWDQMWE